MIAFRVLRGDELVEWSFFGYAMHTGRQLIPRAFAVGDGRPHDAPRLWERHAPNCEPDCWGCREARREHDHGDEDKHP